MNRFTAYAALFFMFSLCSTAKEAGFQHPAFNFRGTSTMSALSGDYSAAPTPLYKSWALPSLSNSTTPPPLLLTDRSYYELVQALMSKIRLDFQMVGDMTWRHLSEMLFASWNSVREVSLRAASVTLWAIISIWFGLYWTLARLITLFLWTFSIEALCLILLGCITSLIYKGALSLSEHLPVFLFMSPLKIIWRAAFSKRNYKNERAVEGYKGFSVPQKPPKSAVIELQHENGSHLGYANCIRLYSGENAWVTAEHCLEGAFATSLKTGNRIPMSTFFPIFKSTRNDISILVGPPNWEGLLSVKGAHFITADKIGKGPASFYTLEKGEWMCHSATIDGAHHQFVSVLCNTGPGYSGTGFWSSKNLLGVLKGFPLEEECNYNVMSVIPSIPGITSPNYVFESTAVKGRVFSDEAVKELEREASEAVKKLARFKSLTGKNWADDYDSDEDYGLEREAATNAPAEKTAQTNSAEKTAPSTSAEKTAPTNKPLNGQAAPSAKTNGNSDIPDAATSAPPMDKMVEQIITAMVGRINLSEIEEKIVSRVSQKALQKPKQKKRGRRGGKNKHNSSPPTSTQSTSGAPKKEAAPQASGSAGTSRATTTPAPEAKPSGGKNSAKFIPSWRRKQQDSAGQKPDLKLNSKA
uniref:P1 polyprotein n=1 Tax=Potato leafroll virus TaxID=12045 RepID=A0A223LKN7_PLRV|nr:P1 polyprotein [Potato leafroll virus]